MRTRKIYFMRIKKLLIYMIILTMILMLAFNSDSSIEAVKGALLLCYRTIIPSLFPFFVLSGLLIQSGFAGSVGRVISPLMYPLLKVGGSGALAFIIGIISGYPTGAKMVVELYEKRLISRDEARRLLPYCNNSGPLFIIGAVGTGILGSHRLGVYLYAVHIAAALLVGFIFRFYKGEKTFEKGINMFEACSKKDNSFGEIFSLCVSDAVKPTLLICGFVALFSSVLECVKPVINALISAPMLRQIIAGIFEVTMGVNNVASGNGNLVQVTVVISFLIGFGGICVHLQVLGILAGSGLGMKTYLAGKLLHGALAAAISATTIKLLPDGYVDAWIAAENFKMPVESRGALITFVVLCIALVYCVYKQYLNHLILKRKHDILNT